LQTTTQDWQLFCVSRSAFNFWSNIPLENCIGVAWNVLLQSRSATLIANAVKSRQISEPDVKSAEIQQMVEESMLTLQGAQELRQNAEFCWQRATSIQPTDGIFPTCPLLPIIHRLEAMFSLYEATAAKKQHESDMYRQGSLKYLDDLISQQRQSITTRELPIVLSSDDLHDLQELREHVKERFAITNKHWESFKSRSLLLDEPIVQPPQL
jgi:hypothetical protein